MNQKPRFDNLSDYQTYVLDSLARLETHMESLVGNGQPGRIKIVEDNVRSLDRRSYWLAGAAAGVGVLLSTVLRLVFKLS
jgi:hypothetical protein